MVDGGIQIQLLDRQLFDLPLIIPEYESAGTIAKVPTRQLLLSEAIESAGIGVALEYGNQC